MEILAGILLFIFLCGSILILASFPISLHEKSGFIRKKSSNNDAFRYLFEVYEE